MSRVLVLAFVCCGVCAAQAREIDVRPDAYLVPGAPAYRVSSYATGFEAAEGFAVGDINNQAGWGRFTGDSGPVIAVGNPATGLQHLRIADDPLESPGFPGIAAFSPNFGPQVGDTAMSIDVCISATDGADYYLNPQAPSQGAGLTTARVRFAFNDANNNGTPGDILILDDPDGPAGNPATFFNSGVAYTPGVYKPFRIEVRPAANQILYYYDGNLIYTGAVWAGSSIEQIVLLDDQFQMGDFADFDNLSFTPEPASVALLGLAVAVCRRR